MIAFSLHKKLQAANDEMLFHVKYEIAQNALIGIYGPSGAGKTSLLRMFAGFLEPDSGTLRVNNRTWYDSKEKINLAPQKRNTGFVFQDYALFPNMTVKENLLFALDKETPKGIVDDLLMMVELEQFYKRKIQTLSGGQRQRVALARALVRKPELLLLDEPLSALDSELREKLQSLLLKIHEEFNLTTILVSHDIAEMMRLTDEIIFLKNGMIEKHGSPVSIFSSTQNKETVQLTGIVIGKKKRNIICLLIGKDLVELLCMENEIATLNKGDTVIVSFNECRPAIKKI
jgi:molybdate transport system ATP-binding protein